MKSPPDAPRNTSLLELNAAEEEEEEEDNFGGFIPIHAVTEPLQVNEYSISTVCGLFVVSNLKLDIKTGKNPCNVRNGLRGANEFKETDMSPSPIVVTTEHLGKTCSPIQVKLLREINAPSSIEIENCPVPRGRIKTPNSAGFTCTTDQPRSSVEIA